MVLYGCLLAARRAITTNKWQGGAPALLNLVFDGYIYEPWIYAGQDESYVKFNKVGLYRVLLTVALDRSQTILLAPTSG